MRDYAEAKRKAAQRLGIGIHDEALLPRNSDIEQALRERLALFDRGRQPDRLHRLRLAAIEAMEFFRGFDPRLVGSVLDGTADDHSPVALHVFSDEPDAIGHFLADNRIPFDREDRRLRLDARREIIAQAFLFMAGTVPFDVTSLPLDGLRQAPLDRNGQRPMARASLARVRELADTAPGGAPPP